MSFIRRYQPLRALYKLWQHFIVIPFFYFPLWMLSAIPVLRNKPGAWNLTRHLRACYERHSVCIMYQSDFGHDLNHLSLADEPDSNGVWIRPVPDHYILGNIRTRADFLQIGSVSVPGYWIHKYKAMVVGEPPSPGEKVILFLHGGGYVSHTAHPDGPISIIPKKFLEHCESLHRTFSVEYRLSTGPPLEPVNQFPAALLDALAGYLYLVEMGFKESNIVLMGDSAGGNAALALTKYLVEHGGPVEIPPALPNPPGSLVLLSPWADVSESFQENVDPRSSQVRFSRYDTLGRLDKWPILYFATAFAGARPEDRKEACSNSYISPASPEVLGLRFSSPRTVSFKGFPRTWIDMGGLEALLDQGRRLRDGMVEDMGEGLVYYNEVEGATHDYLVAEWQEPVRTETFIKISGWLEGGWGVSQ